MQGNQTALVSALDWGLGHATRTAEVIRTLISAGYQIEVVASSKQITFFRSLFPETILHLIPAFKIVYSESNSQTWAVIKALPRLMKLYGLERKCIRKLIRSAQYDLIVSDNRYGFFHKNIKSVFICHQLQPELPTRLKFLQRWVHWFHKKLIQRFDECWIPDIAGHQISGKLSGSNEFRLPIKFIGLLSRLSGLQNSSHINNAPDLLFLISGPENQRSIFERRILEQIPKLTSSISYLIVRGVSQEASEIDNAINAPSSALLRHLIKESKYIICRSGYSTIMDLLCQNKTAVIVPTPGQSEQEYLAMHLSSKKKFLAMKQANFDLVEAVKCLKEFHPSPFYYHNTELMKVIEALNIHPQTEEDDNKA